MAELDKTIRVIESWMKQPVLTPPPINELYDALELMKEQKNLGTELTNAVELIHKKNERIEKLLKEQEAVEPSFKQDEKGIFVWCCGSCGAYMYHIYDGIDKAKEYAKFCRQCGKPVLWEGR